MQDWTLTQAFDSEGGEVRWDVLGEGPPVVLTHGTPFSSFVWRDIARALSRRFRVHVWDLVGYGQSEQRDDQDVSLATQARILAGLLQHWGLERPHLVGHDFGGAITLRALLLEGATAERLVLVDPVAVAPWGTGFFQLAAEHAELFLKLPPPVHDGLVRGYVRWAAHHHLDDEVVDRLVAPWSSERGRRALYRQIAQNDQRLTDEIQPRYAELGLPTLIVWGERDAWIPLERGQQLQELIPNSQLRTIADAGHLVQEDAPTELVAELVGFLAPDPRP